jgi:hypothetical protein
VNTLVAVTQALGFLVVVSMCNLAMAFDTLLPSWLCSRDHVPGFQKHEEALKAKGVDTIAVVSVNDPFVMAAWGEKVGAWHCCYHCHLYCNMSIWHLLVPNSHTAGTRAQVQLPMSPAAAAAAAAVVHPACWL